MTTNHIFGIVQFSSEPHNRNGPELQKQLLLCFKVSQPEKCNNTEMSTNIHHLSFGTDFKSA